MFKSPIVRQLLVAGSPQLAALSAGGSMGYPGVLLQQLKGTDSSIHLDLDNASWIGSIHGFAGLLSVLMPTLMQWKGRRFAFITTCMFTIIGWVTIYFATNVTTLLLGESFHGIGGHSLLFISMSSISEMVTPKFRNVSMLIFGTTQFFSIGLVDVIGQYLHWKTISLVMIAPNVVAMLIACFWPESPSWLACNGEFDKCQQAFVRLRGNDEESEKELNALITAQKEILQSVDSSKNYITLRDFLRKVTSRDFYLPSLDMFVLINSVYWSGIMVILIYATQVVEKATSDKNAAAFGNILLNSLTAIGILLSSILVKCFNNKSVLLTSISGTAVSLFGACVVTYLQSTNVLTKDSLLCLYCLIAYAVASSFGITAVSIPIASELMPVKHRGVGGALNVIYSCLLFSSSLKAAPYLFLYIDLWGTFLIYMFNAIICGLYIWKYVPETKNRTLQEIENYYMYTNFNRTCLAEEKLVSAPIVKYL